MSTWLHLLNEIKRRPPEHYLTVSQRAVRDQIADWLRYPQWVNLYGKPGAGKTFVAWSLVRAIGALHISLPSSLKGLVNPPDIVLIDNAPYSESDVRRIFSTCELLSIPSVVLLTRQPVRMPMKSVELPLPTPDDLVVVTRSLGLLNYPCKKSLLPGVPNFWDVLQACI